MEGGGEGAVEFKHKRHVQFFERFLMMCPAPVQTLDSNRMTLLLFCFGALDTLGVGAGDEQANEPAVSWIWAQQAAKGGFRPGPELGPGVPADSPMAGGHLAMT